MKWILCIFLCAFFCGFSQKTIDVSNLKVDTIPYFPNVEILTDSLHQFSTKNIREANTQFKPFIPGTCSSPHINHYWLRTKVKTNVDGKWVLEFLDPHIYEITLYQKKRDSLVQNETTVGFNKPFNVKKYQHKNFIFDINGANYDTTTYYVEFTTRQVNCFLFKIRTANSLVNYSITEYSLLCFYYGLLTLIIIYNLMIYARVRERVYLYYVAYVFSCILNSLAEDGLGFQYLWSNYPAVNQFIEKWNPDILLFTFMLYSITFLRLSRMPRPYFVILFGLCFAHILANFINYEFYFGQLNFKQLYLIPFAVIYVLALYKLCKGEKHLKYFVIGYSFILSSLVIYYLRTHGILLFHWFIYIYAFNIGFVLEALVLSYSLGERIRLDKQEKEQAQQNLIAQLEENKALRENYTQQLEKQVAERTHQLKEANEEIKTFNDFLEQKNLKLEKEVVDITTQQVESKLMSLDDFKKVYASDDICKEFLSKLKWQNKPYKCGKCGHETEIPHKVFYKRCASCKYVESCTTNTIYHSIKTPLPEAFYLTYAIFTQKTITALELNQATGVSEKSCAGFKKELQVIEKTLKPKDKKKGWVSMIIIV